MCHIKYWDYEGLPLRTSTCLNNNTIQAMTWLPPTMIRPLKTDGNYGVRFSWQAPGRVSHSKSASVVKCAFVSVQKMYWHIFKQRGGKELRDCVVFLSQGHHLVNTCSHLLITVPSWGESTRRVACGSLDFLEANGFLFKFEMSRPK